MTREELLARLGSLRRASVAGVRVPHKALLLLWLFSRFAATGSSQATYAEAEEPVSQLINEFGPPVVTPAATRQRAAMPFVHLERELWDLRGADGSALGADTPERRRRLLDMGAVGRLRPDVEQHLADPGTLTAAARLLLDSQFTPTLAEVICAAVGLDLSVLDTQPAVQPSVTRRRPGFAEEVLRAYAYACAACGFDGALGRTPVGLQAAHVRWRSLGGPDTVANGVALCALHHVLFDLGVLGLTVDLRIQVSPLYVARSASGCQVDALADRPLARPRPGQPTIEPTHVTWHQQQVFKAGAAAA